MPANGQTGDDQLSEDEVSVPYPHSLYLCVGQVVVHGARVEGALARLLRHLDPARLDQAHDEVMWDPVEKAIRKALVTSEPDVAKAVGAALDWAETQELRSKRNRTVHDQYSLLSHGDLQLSLRMRRGQSWETIEAPHHELQVSLLETAELLLRFESALDDLTSWIRSPIRRAMLPPKPFT
jgi:hypothetical protein